ncbi:unnamed protein product [Trichobilharzia regenti]|nr:unnamed protein product [Trichobilharzia regenti]
MLLILFSKYKLNRKFTHYVNNGMNSILQQLIKVQKWPMLTEKHYLMKPLNQCLLGSLKSAHRLLLLQRKLLRRSA